MKRKMFAAAVAVAGVLGAAGMAEAAAGDSASGHGSLQNNTRQFSFSAKEHADGTVSGHATLINKNFSGTPGSPAPYRLQMDITCMKVVGNVAIFGGMVKSTNDPNLVDAAFFSVQDNGEPGRGVDKISRVFFWDDDPTTTGDPMACLLVGPTDFPLETIENGNVQVKSTAVSAP